MFFGTIQKIFHRCSLNPPWLELLFCQLFLILLTLFRGHFSWFVHLGCSWWIKFRICFIVRGRCLTRKSPTTTILAVQRNGSFKIPPGEIDLEMEYSLGSFPARFLFVHDKSNIHLWRYLLSYLFRTLFFWIFVFLLLRHNQKSF